MAHGRIRAESFLSLLIPSLCPVVSLNRKSGKERILAAEPRLLEESSA